MMYYGCMPTVNIFHSSDKDLLNINTVQDKLKAFIAKELTCGDIQLKSDEVSIRCISVAGGGMIASIEVEITAHGFKDRIQKQDEIANSVGHYLMDLLHREDIRVWLLLPQLGHSW